MADEEVPAGLARRRSSAKGPQLLQGERIRRMSSIEMSAASSTMASVLERALGEQSLSRLPRRPDLSSAASLDVVRSPLRLER